MNSNENLLDRIRRFLVDEENQRFHWKSKLVHEQMMNNVVDLLQSFHFQYHQIKSPNSHNQDLPTKPSMKTVQ